MKKFFFFAAALVASVAASAQEIYIVDQEAYPTESQVKNDGATKTSVDAGATLYTGTAFDVKNAFATTYQRVGLNANNFVNMTMGDAVVIAGADQWGIQGNDNPKDADGKNVDGNHKTPVSGAVFEFDAKQDGVAFFFHKASSNKVYTVFENYNGESTAIGYHFAMITCPSGKTNTAGKVSWLKDVEVLPLLANPADSLLTYDPDVDDDNYVNATIMFPEIHALGTFGDYGNIADSSLVVKNGAYCLNGLGIIMFPVEANTSYYVNACGSKMSLAAVAYVSQADASKCNVVVSDGTISHTLFEYIDTAVENVENNTKVTKTLENNQIVIEKNGVKYNVLGAIVK